MLDIDSNLSDKRTLDTYAREATDNFNAGRWQDAGAAFEYLFKQYTSGGNLAEGDIPIVDVVLGFKCAAMAVECWFRAEDSLRLGSVLYDLSEIGPKIGTIIGVNHAKLNRNNTKEEAKAYELLGKSLLLYNREKGLEYLDRSLALYIGSAKRLVENIGGYTKDVFELYTRAEGILVHLRDPRELQKFRSETAKLYKRAGDRIASAQSVSDADMERVADLFIRAARLYDEIGDRSQAEKLGERGRALLLKYSKYDF